MSVRRIPAGLTDVSVTLRIVDSTDGTPETGVVFNSAGIDLWYRRELAAAVDIIEVTLAALTTAHADGGFLHIADGWYRLDLPDAAIAAGVTGVQIGGTITGMIVLAPYIELPVNTATDVFTRLGAPAGASVSADIAAIEAQTDDIGTAGAGLTAVPWNAAWDVEVQSEVADALAVYDPPTNAEMELRTLLAANYFDPLTDTVTPAAGSITAAVIAADAIDAAALAADAVQELRDAILAGTITELAIVPAASPTLAQALALLYMSVRNRRDTTATSDEIHNDAGVVVASRTVSDDGVTFTATELI